MEELCKEINIYQCTQVEYIEDSDDEEDIKEILGEYKKIIEMNSLTNDTLKIILPRIIETL